MLSCASSQALNAALKLTVSGRTPLEVSILSDHSAVCSHLALQASSNTSTPGQTHYTHYGSFRGEPYLWIGLDSGLPAFWSRSGVWIAGRFLTFNPCHMRTRHLFCLEHIARW